MTDNLPPWVLRVVRGLADYEATHPKLYAQYAGRTEWEHADYPCHLLREVPADILARATEEGTVDTDLADYLRVQHHTLGLHDHLGADLSCHGCALLADIDTEESR